jgi:uncharacterized membrane protein
MNDALNWIKGNTEVSTSLLGIFITALIAYLTYKKTTRTKQLEFLIVSNEPVVPRVASDKLKITYGKTTVNEASVIVVRIANSGGTPILENDFSTNFGLCLCEAHKIITALATRAKPTDLRPKLSISKNKVFVEQVLINPGDAIELQLLVSGYVDNIVAEGRIAGTKIIHQKNILYAQNRVLRTIDTIATFVWPVSGLFVILTVAFAWETPTNVGETITRALFAFMGLYLLFYMPYRGTTRRRQAKLWEF